MGGMISLGGYKFFHYYFKNTFIPTFFFILAQFLKFLCKILRKLACASRSARPRHVAEALGPLA